MPVYRGSRGNEEPRNNGLAEAAQFIVHTAYVAFEDHYFSSPPFVTDTATRLTWRDIDTAYADLRALLEGVERDFAPFHLTHRSPGNDWPDIINTFYYLYFDRHVCASCVVDRLNMSDSLFVYVHDRSDIPISVPITESLRLMLE